MSRKIIAGLLMSMSLVGCSGDIVKDAIQGATSTVPFEVVEVPNVKKVREVANDILENSLHDLKLDFAKQGSPIEDKDDAQWRKDRDFRLMIITAKITDNYWTGKAVLSYINTDGKTTFQHGTYYYDAVTRRGVFK